MKSKTIKILAILLTACVFLGVASCSGVGGGEEETTETTREPASVELSSLNSDESILQYFNALMAQINVNKAKLNYSSDYDPRGFECDNSAFASALPTIVKLMKKGFNDGLGAEVAYGDPINKLLPTKGTDVPLVLTMADVAIYQAPEDADEADKKNNGKPMIAVNADAFSRYEEASSRDAAAAANLPEGETMTTEYVEVDEDVRRITITLKDEIDPKVGEGLFGKIYDIPDRAKIAEEMSKLSEYVTYDGNYTAKYTGCSIYMEVSRATNEVIKVEFNRNIEVEVEVTGVGTLASLGTTTLKFVVNGADRYEFDYTDPNATTVVAE